MSQVAREPGFRQRHGKSPWTEAKAKKIIVEIGQRRAEASDAAEAADEIADVDLAGCVNFDDAIRRILPTNPLTAAKINALNERSLKTQLEREIKLGGYLVKADEESRRVKVALLFRNNLADWKLRAHELVGLDEAAIAQWLDRMAKHTCDLLAGAAAE